MNTSVREQVIAIQGCLPTPMLGILSQTVEKVHIHGIRLVIVNGGAQYRAGAHRLFVHLARHLAASGHAVLRFDLPGQGDSPGEPLSFEDTSAHIRAAVDALHQQAPQFRQTALIGLCDGASASLLYLDGTPDPRITCLLLFNPWVHSELSEAKAQVRHYYRQRLFMPEFWKRLLTWQIGGAAALELLNKLRLSRQALSLGEPHAFQDRMARSWNTFSGPRLLVLSPQDQTAQEFMDLSQHAQAWRGWDQVPGTRAELIKEADHTFSSAGSLTALLSVIDHFLFEVKPSGAAV